ncbi:MAG: response regulator transcription factor [Terracidiphilus sp.]|jgi:two-component system copper resistance phosphate regulon response regulator CusR
MDSTTTIGANFPRLNTSTGRSILIAEEDPSLAAFLCRELQAASHDVDLTHDGETAFRALQEKKRYDLLVLDLNLPKLDGATLMQRVKPEKPRLAMIVLSARSSIQDKLLAFHSGADDFLAKPLSILELKARVQALLRRHSGLVPNSSQVADLILHRDEHRVERNGRRIDLTPREFAILEYLMRNAGRPVSRTSIFEEVWKAPCDPSTNIVDVYMKYVRDKVDGPGDRKLTHTIRGVGYELSDGWGEKSITNGATAA